MVGLLKGSEIARFALPAPDSVTSRPAAASEPHSQRSEHPMHATTPHADAHPSAYQQAPAVAGALAGASLPAEQLGALEGSSIVLSPPPPEDATEEQSQSPALWHQEQAQTLQTKVEQDRQAADVASTPQGHPAGPSDRHAGQDVDRADIPIRTSAASADSCSHTAANEHAPGVARQQNPSAMPSNESIRRQPMSTADHPASTAGHVADLGSANASTFQHTSPSSSQVGPQSQIEPSRPSVGVQPDMPSLPSSALNPSLTSYQPAETSAATSDHQFSQQGSAAAVGSFSKPAVPDPVDEASANAASKAASAQAGGFVSHAGSSAQQSHALSESPAQFADYPSSTIDGEQPPKTTSAHASGEQERLQPSSMGMPQAVESTAPVSEPQTEPISAAAAQAEQSESADTSSRSGNAMTAAGPSGPLNASEDESRSPSVHAAAESASSGAGSSMASLFLPEAFPQHTRGGAARQSPAASPPPAPAEVASAAAAPGQASQRQPQSVAGPQQPPSHLGSSHPAPSRQILSSAAPGAPSSGPDQLRKSSGLRPAAAQQQAMGSETTSSPQQQQKGIAGSQASSALHPASSPSTAAMSRPAGPATTAQPSIPAASRPAAAAAASAAPVHSASSRQSDATAASDAASEHLRRLRDPFGRMQRASNGNAGASASGGLPQTDALQGPSGLQSRQSGESPFNAATGAVSSPTMSGNLSNAPASVSAQVGSNRPVVSGSGLSSRGSKSQADPLKPTPGAELRQTSILHEPAPSQKDIQQQKSGPSKLTPTPSGHLQRSVTDFNPLA